VQRLRSIIANNNRKPGKLDSHDPMGITGSKIQKIQIVQRMLNISFDSAEAIGYFSLVLG
jgi:hypothetical protein